MITSSPWSRTTYVLPQWFPVLAAIIIQLGSDQSATLDPASEYGPAARIVHHADLNQDGRPDFILRFPEACGNQGECPYAAYLACADGTYAPIWGPDYAVSLDPGPRGTLRLTLRQTRNGRAIASTRTIHPGTADCRRRKN